MDGILLHASHTHLFPGARLGDRGAPLDLPAAWTAVLIVLSDLSECEGRLTRTGSGDGRFRLDLEAYTTSAGTVIPAKSWIAETERAGGEEVSLRVLTPCTAPR